MPVVAVSDITATTDLALARAGVPPGHAVLQRDLLLDAELRGVASHGLLRLPRIIERIANGVTDPAATGHHHWRAPGFLYVDGQRGLGPVVAETAIAALADRAATQGVAIAAIANSNHIGMLGFYAERAALSGKTLIAFSTSEALVHPWGGRRAMIGTNPIAIGIPTETGPFMMDTATAIVSMGEIHDHANREADIPQGWAIDAEGDPTTDAKRARDGAISPFGGAKGYALGLAFELLVSGLAAAAIGRDTKGTLDSINPASKADLFILIDQPLAPLAGYLDALRNEAPAAGFDAVRIPGERGRATRAARERDGVPIPDAVWCQMCALADRPFETRI